MFDWLSMKTFYKFVSYLQWVTIDILTYSHGMLATRFRVFLLIVVVGGGCTILLRLEAAKLTIIRALRRFTYVSRVGVCPW